jgi:general stress protein 26
VSPDLRQQILAILAAGQDMTVATLREDGCPQATTVSYANDGLAIYFGCSAASQKARNIARDGRVSLTITLPYSNWGEIQGLSIVGRANRLTDLQGVERTGQLLLKKFPEGVAEYGSGVLDEIAFIQVIPEVISVLDYRKGFGHTDLVTAPTLASDAEL